MKEREADINEVEGDRVVYTSEHESVLLEDLEAGTVGQPEGNTTSSPLELQTARSLDQESFYKWFMQVGTLYAEKFQGVDGKVPPKMTPFLQILISSLLAFIGIFLVAVTDFWYLQRTFEIHDRGITMLTGVYGATAVLVYEAYHSPLSQPRNVIGGCAVSSFLGVSTRLVCDAIGIPPWVNGAIAVCIAIIGMTLTKTVHPPGGGCALIAVTGGPLIYSLGYGYVLTSVGAAIIMVAVAVIGNNLVPSRQYPLYWA